MNEQESKHEPNKHGHLPWVQLDHFAENHRCLTERHQQLASARVEARLCDIIGQQIAQHSGSKCQRCAQLPAEDVDAEGFEDGDGEEDAGAEHDGEEEADGRQEQVLVHEVLHRGEILHDGKQSKQQHKCSHDNDESEQSANGFRIVRDPVFELLAIRSIVLIVVHIN